MWGAIIGGAASIFGAVSASKAAKKTKIAAGLNADLVRQETQEEIRRTKIGIESSEGMAAAVSAASGVTMSGSRALAVQETKKENKAQLAWLAKSGKQREKAVRAGGQLQASQLKSQAIVGGLSGAAQLGQGLFGKGGLFS